MKEDYYSNTPEDARKWQEHFNDEYLDDDKPSAWEFDDEIFEEDDCNCSDPGCPCRGYKIGNP